MTCIVALIDEKGNSFLGAERGASDTNVIFPLRHAKVWKRGEYLFGYFGSFAGEKIKHGFIPPSPITGEFIDLFMNTTFLKDLNEFYDESHIPRQEELGLVIMFQGHIFIHNAQDMSMSEVDLKYFAEGSGMEFALGSLYSTEGAFYSRERVSKALEAAIKFCTTCIGPIDIISDVS